MLGRRFNRLGAAIRQAFNLSRVFPSGSYGGYYLPGNSAYTRQTYNAPATATSSAGDPVGLLMPAQANEAIVNLLLETGNYAATVWGKTRATISSNVVLGPWSTPTADKLVEDSSTNTHFVEQTATTVSGVVYTYSCYAKQGERTQIVLSLFDSMSRSAIFNLAAGTSGSDFNCTSSISAAANGFYRCSITFTCSFSGTSFFDTLLYNGSSTNYTGNGTSGAYLEGAQLNLGSTALAYQPNAGSLGGSNRRTGGSNMLPWSATPGSVGWTQGSLYTLTLNTTDRVSPITGTYTATKAVRGGAGDNVLARGPVSINATGSYTVTIYVYVPSGQSGVSNWRMVPDLGDVDFGANYDSTTFDQWVRATSIVTATATRTFVDFNFTLTSGAALPSGTVFYVSDAMVNIGSTPDTYSRNMDQLGGLLQSVVPFQGTSANRATLARRPKSGIRNLLTSYSNDISQSAWTKTNTTVTGTTLLVENTANAEHVLLRAVTIVSGQSYTVSAEFEASGRTKGRLIMYRNGGSFGGFYVDFDLSNGTIGTVTASGTGVATSASISLVSSGVYRVSISGTAETGGTAANIQVYLRNASGNTSYTGNGTSGMYCRKWMIQTGTTLGNYQEVGTGVHDITESGQPDVWHTYYDGTSDYADTGVQSFGTASLFAAAGQAWTVWGVFRSTTTGNQSILSKAGAGATRTLHVKLTAGGNISVDCRNSETAIAAYSATEGFAVWCVRWNGTTLTGYKNNATAVTLSVGSAVEEAENILVAARTTAAPATYFPGHNDVAMIDRALTDAEVTQLMSYLNNTYRRTA